MIAVLLTTALALMETGFDEDIIKEEMSELADELLDWGAIIKAPGVGAIVDEADDKVIELLVNVMYDAAKRIHTRRQKRTNKRAARVEAKLEAAKQALIK
jgi:hypothetical protein